MLTTVHMAEKDVRVEIGILPEGLRKGVSEFSHSPFEVCVSARDGSYTIVGYMSKEELNALALQAEACLQEHDRVEAARIVKDAESA